MVQRAKQRALRARPAPEPERGGLDRPPDRDRSGESSLLRRRQRRSTATSTQLRKAVPPPTRSDHPGAGLPPSRRTGELDLSTASRSCEPPDGRHWMRPSWRRLPHGSARRLRSGAARRSRMPVPALAQAEIGRLEELRAETVEERIQAELALGLAAELVGELETLVRAEPFRELRRAATDARAVPRGTASRRARGLPGRAPPPRTRSSGSPPALTCRSCSSRSSAQDPALRASVRHE